MCVFILVVFNITKCKEFCSVSCANLFYFYLSKVRCYVERLSYNDDFESADYE